MKTTITEYEEFDDSDTWGGLAISGGPGRQWFYAELQYNSCCGIMELCHIGANVLIGVEDQDAMIAAFHAAIPEIGEKARKGIVHLTLNIYEGHDNPVQPAWFIKAVETYPGAVSLPWVLNPNSDNQIRMFMLPTGTQKR